MIKTSVADAKARLSEYLAKAERGERIVICRHNTPVAELGPIAIPRTQPRPLGQLPGRPSFVVAASAFEPLSDAEIDDWEGGAVHVRKVAAGGLGRASRVAEKRGTYKAGVTPTGRRRTRS